MLSRRSNGRPRRGRGGSRVEAPAKAGAPRRAALREFKDSLAHSDDEAPEDAERITA